MGIKSGEEEEEAAAEWGMKNKGRGSCGVLEWRGSGKGGHETGGRREVKWRRRERRRDRAKEIELADRRPIKCLI